MKLKPADIAKARELVVRARDTLNPHAMEDDDPISLPYIWGLITEYLANAVDDIERLTAENARLTRLNEDKFAHLQAYGKAADEDRATIAGLTAEIARLRKALEPEEQK